MKEPLKHFLLIYDCSRGELREVRPFRRPVAAVAAYQAAEKKYDSDDNVQVVLVAADSLTTVQRTHSNFWRGETIEGLIREIVTSA